MKGYSEDDFLRGMKSGWCGGGDETKCGSGSRLEQTVEVRERLPALVDQYDVGSICDAGAGDLNWIRHIKWPYSMSSYHAFDLFPRHPDVRALDIRKEQLPTCDLILCRLVLNHMQAEDVVEALALFRKSARLLLATQDDGEHRLESFASYNDWNLTSEPFSLGEPLERIPDTKGRSLALWKLS